MVFSPPFMDTIGKTLKDAREKLGLTLEEVERGTRIRVHYLEAMEQGHFEALSSGVQARGFLGNYAEYLGLDRGTILLQYAETIQKRSPGPRVEKKVKPTQPVRSTRRVRWLSSDLIVTSLIVLFMIVMVVWGGSRILSALRVEDTTLAQAEELVQPTRTATPMQMTVDPGSALMLTPDAEDATPETVVPLLPGLITNVQLRLVAEQRSYVEVRVDGEEVFVGRMGPGEEREFVGQDTVEVLTGNAGGIHVYFNDQDQGVLGLIGEVIIRVWTQNGLITPTPTTTPTPTITPTPTVTPIVSETPATPSVEPVE